MVSDLCPALRHENDDASVAVSCASYSLQDKSQKTTIKNIAYLLFSLFWGHTA